MGIIGDRQSNKLVKSGQWFEPRGFDRGLDPMGGADNEEN
jgi:hypothetical protein